MNRHWIKLWLELLDHPSYGPLPDDLWRVVVELWLVAGEEDKDGKVPGTGALSWRLRRPENELETMLTKLEQVGAIRQLKTGWLVPGFKKRQSAVPALERKRASRRHEGTGGYRRPGHENVSTCDQNREEQNQNQNRGRGDKQKLPSNDKRERFLN